MTSRPGPVVGLSLLHLNNLGGTGCYTRRILEAFPPGDPSSVRLVGLAPPGEETGPLGRPIRPVPRRALRWPFRLGADRLGRATSRGLDLVHYPTGVGPPLRNTPTIVTLHDISPLLFPEFFPPLTGLYLRRAFKASVETAALVVTDTEWQARRIREAYPLVDERLRVVHPCADPAFHTPDAGSESRGRSRGSGRPFCLFVGTREPRKNLVRLVEGWSASRFPGDLVLVGRWGWKYKDLVRTLEARSESRSRTGSVEVWRMGKDRSVQILGRVPSSELPRLYREAFCSVYPSLFEGFGLPILEAMISGCPVVTAQDSAMEEVAGEAGWFFDPRNPESLADALDRAFEDPGGVRRKVELGIARSRSFGADSFRSGIEAIYRECLEGT